MSPRLSNPEWAGYMLGKTLLGRLGRPEEVASVALFLASGESSYVTGVDIVVGPPSPRDRSGACAHDKALLR
jgi:NAD(P)-dependent dehydrogenase (short-subunit alcohol dehydrogenase family)